MSDTFGELALIPMSGCEEFLGNVDYYLKEWKGDGRGFITKAACPRFGSGEAKGIVYESMRGHDVYILCDCFNYGVTYNMYGMTVPMSPDEHFADLKRIIGAIMGKARRITVIMPMLYEGRQHRRNARESLDCAMMLQELSNLGVTNLITFDAHDARVQNAIPLKGFDNVQPTYQMIKALIRNVPDLTLNSDHVMIVSPDEGGMHRCMYFASVLQLELGMFYKRRNYTKVIDGRNPIEAHEYLGKPVEGKDVIIVDDMISTGDSMIEIAEKLKDKGASRIFAFSSFGLFCSGLERFDRAYEKKLIDKIFTTNLIYRTPELLRRPWYCEVNMCKYVAMLIECLHRDETISALLDPAQKIHSFVERSVAEGLIKI